MAADAADPALIAVISGGAAVLGGLVGGGLGYIGVSKQMREQRHLEQLAHRRAAYVAFVEVSRRFMRGSGVLAFDEEKWTAFIPEHDHKLLELSLVAVPEVLAAANEFQDEMKQMMDSVQHEEAVSGAEARQKALLQHEDAMDQALDNLIATMRSDIGPT